MKDKIEVGEYIKTAKGQIDIFKEYGESNLFARCKKRTYWIGDIKKHSLNIIDLIEIGDYVNGHRVLKKEKEDTKWCIVTEGADDYYWYYEDEIISILTKQQYAQNCYRLEE